MLSRFERSSSASNWIRLALVICFLSALGLDLLGQTSRWASVKSGRELYMGACASCHGATGRGVPQEQVGFELELPDFTDCGFASREPNADWLAIAHQGGPSRAFSHLMPAFGDAITVEQLDAILGHIRSFCSDRAWPRGELNLPRSLITEKAYPEDEAVWTTTIDVEGDGAIFNEIVFEKRFGPRSQVELAVPFGWFSDPDGEWRGGIDDVAIGFKHAVFHSFEKGSIFSFGAEAILPTGNENKGFGKGTTVFEPFVLFGQILPQDFFLHLQGGVELPTDTDRADREALWRAAVGKSLTQGRWGRSWSPMLEVLGARELVTEGETSWDLLPQVQVTLSKRQHIMLNVGVRFPVNRADERETQILFYLLWDWFDGGFLDGW